MATHEVSVEFTVQMQEMDGHPDESAEVFLSVYSEDARKAVEDATGLAVVHWEVTAGEEADG